MIGSTVDVKSPGGLRRELFAGAQWYQCWIALVLLGGPMTKEIHATLKLATRTTLMVNAATLIVAPKAKEC